jgi:hypothetical protein
VPPLTPDAGHRDRRTVQAAAGRLLTEPAFAKADRSVGAQLRSLPGPDDIVSVLELLDIGADSGGGRGMSLG